MKNVLDLVFIIISAFVLVFVIAAIIFTTIVQLENPFTFEFGEITGYLKKKLKEIN
jgi:hypothetical protein